jgi:hypothetical protein
VLRSRDNSKKNDVAPTLILWPIVKNFTQINTISGGSGFHKKNDAAPFCSGSVTLVINRLQFINPNPHWWWTKIAILF